MKPFSLYLHIPFCFHKCPYCDFNTYAVSAIPEKEYVSALLAELDYRASLPEWRARVVQTIYFGGGTPSLFQPASIRKVISAICKTFPLDENAEISLEANPGTVTADSLAGYREAGVNRLSLGAQSFDRSTLKTLGRMHSPEQIEAAVESAHGAGLHNINIDLIYGVPDQTLESLKEDLVRTLALKPTHVSPYGLTIEKGTPFHLSYKKGALKLPKEDLVVSMMEEINDFLPMHGLHRYEVSNYSHIGKEAKHNLAYWSGTDYLGLGAGAHSFCADSFGGEHFGLRWSNFALPVKYISETAAHGRADSWSDKLGYQDAMFEYFFLGLRKTAGITLKDFEARFGTTVQSLYPALLHILSEERLIKIDADRLALTSRGFMLADSVIENFIQPEKKVEAPPAVQPAMTRAAESLDSDGPMVANFK
ncbi:MAG: radical SAM family heme chaperone HemW [Deltaproteobacteria bacterium]|nr:radical SAM family heme chaperone HemW [Deltaproteobacteria bacterium]